MLEYLLITGSSTTLTKEVNTALSDGWELSGPPIASGRRTVDVDGSNMYRTEYAQAVVRPRMLRKRSRHDH